MILDDDISDEIRNLFSKYFDKYCKYENILKITRDIISDINYFDEHISRTKKSENFSYEVIISLNGYIYEGFVKKIGEYIAYYKHDARICMVYISLYEIMKGIFSDYHLDDSKAVSEYIEFEQVLKGYLDLQDDESIFYFVGESRGQDEFFKKLYEERRKIKENLC